MSKARVLFLSHALVGHLNPLIAVMQRLRAEGYEVTCLTPADQAISETRRAALAGIELRTYANVAAAAAARAAKGRVGDSGSKWAYGVIANVAEQAPIVSEAISACAPHFAVVDPFPLNAAAVGAVHQSGVPYALLWPNLLPVAPLAIRTGFRKIVDESLRDVLAPFGVAWSEEFASPRSPILNMCPVIPELIEGAVPGVELVGLPEAPAKRGDEIDFDWSRLPASPFVYLSFGTIFERRDLLEMFARAARRLDLRIVASVGRLARELGDLGDHVVAVEYLPQREVLPQARAFVTHGGYNSFAESLRVGTPMLVVPLSLDQPLQAHYAAASGAGRAIAPAELTEDRIEEALAALVSEGSTYRVRADRLSRAATAVDTTKITADLIDGAIRASC